MSCPRGEHAAAVDCFAFFCFFHKMKFYLSWKGRNVKLRRRKSPVAAERRRRKRQTVVRGQHCYHGDEPACSQAGGFRARYGCLATGIRAQRECEDSGRGGDKQRRTFEIKAAFVALKRSPLPPPPPGTATGSLGNPRPFVPSEAQQAGS